MKLTRAPIETASLNFHDTKPAKKSSDNTYVLEKHSGKRDAIIGLIRLHHSGDEFAKPFIAHLMKIGKKKLDEYSEIEFLLKESGQRLVFTSSRMEKNEMTYTIPKLALEPDVRLAARTSWWPL